MTSSANTLTYISRMKAIEIAESRTFNLKRAKCLVLEDKCGLKPFSLSRYDCFYDIRGKRKHVKEALRRKHLPSADILCALGAKDGSRHGIRQRKKESEMRASSANCATSGLGRHFGCGFMGKPIPERPVLHLSDALLQSTRGFLSWNMSMQVTIEGGLQAKPLQVEVLE